MTLHINLYGFAGMSDQLKTLNEAQKLPVEFLLQRLKNVPIPFVQICWAHVIKHMNSCPHSLRLSCAPCHQNSKDKIGLISCIFHIDLNVLKYVVREYILRLLCSHLISYSMLLRY